MHDLNNILEEVCINFSISAEDAKKLTLGEVDALLKQELLKEKAAVIKRNSEDAEYVKKVSTCFPHWEYFCNKLGDCFKNNVFNKDSYDLFNSNRFGSTKISTYIYSEIVLASIKEAYPQLFPYKIYIESYQSSFRGIVSEDGNFYFNYCYVYLSGYYIYFSLYSLLEGDVKTLIDENFTKTGYYRENNTEEDKIKIFNELNEKFNNKQVQKFLSIVSGIGRWYLLRDVFPKF